MLCDAVALLILLLEFIVLSFFAVLASKLDTRATATNIIGVFINLSFLAGSTGPCFGFFADRYQWEEKGSQADITRPLCPVSL